MDQKDYTRKIIELKIKESYTVATWIVGQFHKTSPSPAILHYLKIRLSELLDFAGEVSQKYPDIDTKNLKTRCWNLHDKIVDKLAKEAITN